MNKIEKAIEILNNCYKTVSMCLTSDDCDEHNKAIDLAIHALEKQIPKRVIRESWNVSKCPNCYGNLGEYLGDGYVKDWEHLKICDCGQKLDWSYKHDYN